MLMFLSSGEEKRNSCRGNYRWTFGELYQPAKMYLVPDEDWQLVAICNVSWMLQLEHLFHWGGPLTFPISPHPHPRLQSNEHFSKVWSFLSGESGRRSWGTREKSCSQMKELWPSEHPLGQTCLLGRLKAADRAGSCQHMVNFIPFHWLRQTDHPCLKGEVLGFFHFWVYKPVCRNQAKINLAGFSEVGQITTQRTLKVSLRAVKIPELEDGGCVCVRGCHNWS